VEKEDEETAARIELCGEKMAEAADGVKLHDITVVTLVDAHDVTPPPLAPSAVAEKRGDSEVGTIDPVVEEESRSLDGDGAEDASGAHVIGEQERNGVTDSGKTNGCDDKLAAAESAADIDSLSEILTMRSAVHDDDDDDAGVDDDDEDDVEVDVDGFEVGIAGNTPAEIPCCSRALSVLKVLRED
jgi:hypothetical protein